MTDYDKRRLTSNLDEVVAGFRVQRGSRREQELVKRQASWLESLSCDVCADAPRGDILREALLDIYSLSEGLPASVAAWSNNWRYVWPRDASHVAVALALVGDFDRSFLSLSFLKDVPRRRGVYEARYTPDEMRAPDDRPAQLDGTGWVLWGLGSVFSLLPETEREGFLERFGSLAVELGHALADLVHAYEGSLPASPDYWEREENSLTLGTVGPCLAGLNSSTAMLAAYGDTRLRDVRNASRELTLETVRTFGRHGYQRYHRGGGLDSAISFLLPPYNWTYPDAHVALDVYGSARTALERPAGGIAPGEAWHQDGISWTPETSLFAMTAAYAKMDFATDYLEWLASHRTDGGSLPEKVLETGAPAAVAPLAWTAANVVIAAMAENHEVLLTDPDAA